MYRHHRRQERLLHAIRRDVVFIFVGILAYSIVAYVETRANDVEIRKGPGVIARYFSSKHNYSESFTVCNGQHDRDDCNLQQQQVKGCHSSSSTQTNSSCKNEFEHYIAPTGIIDAGFIITAPIHHYLAKNRHINDALAMINSAIFVLPGSYVAYSTLWKGDFRLAFQIIATGLFRALCGWFTYLPPDPQFLTSYYDFPEIFLCFIQDCSTESQNVQEDGLRATVIVPFVTFFSGHIATLLIIANHLYMRRHTRASMLLHCCNWFQAIRLLATRGHYSIDLIIGYVVAVFVSSPAERLGLYYSCGILPTPPQSLIETFEMLVGVSTSNSTERNVGDKTMDGLSMGLSSSSEDDDDDPHKVESETSVRVIAEIVSGFTLAFLSSEALSE
eukprot:scaffold658_cov148-Skeletonema_menzelii.AAC.9